MNFFGLQIDLMTLAFIVVGFITAAEFLMILALFVLIPESFTLLYNKMKKGIVAVYDREDGVRDIFTPKIDKETGLIDLEGKYFEITPRAIIPLKCGVRSLWLSPKLNRGITGYDVDAPYRYNPASMDVKVEQKAEARAIEKRMVDTAGMLNKIGPIVAILMVIGIMGYLIIQAAGNYSFCKGLVVNPTYAPTTTLFKSPTTTRPSGPIEVVSPRTTRPPTQATTVATTVPTTAPTTVPTTTLPPVTTTSLRITNVYGG